MLHNRAMQKTNKIAKGTKKMVAKNFVLPMVGAFVSQFPEFLPHWTLVQGFFGSLFDLQQDKINDFVEFIKNNKTTFSKEVIDTQDFKDGFLITFQEYIKQRNEQKRKYIQNIFLGFALSNNKINFEMERMYDLLNKLSEYQFFVLSRFNGNKKLKINFEERDDEESDYDDIRYLQSLGLLNVVAKRELDVQVTTTKKEYDNGKHSGVDYPSEADSTLEESETFYLSFFGEDFIKFIVDYKSKYESKDPNRF